MLKKFQLDVFSLMLNNFLSHIIIAKIVKILGVTLVLKISEPLHAY